MACGILDSGSRRLTIGLDRPHAGFASTMEAFGELMGRYPLYNWDPALNDGRPFRRSQFFGDREFRDLDIFAEVYRPLGIDNHCAFHVPSQKGEIVFFGIERAGGPDFSDEELGVLQLAQGQLANALAFARLQDAAPDDRVEPALLARAGLTPREAETLSWIAEGKSNPEIAILMNLSLHTVKDHITAIFNKTGAGNRLSAVVWARRVCRRKHLVSVGRHGCAQVPVRFGAS